MLQNQPITTPLFQNSLRSWRANYLARQQAQTAEPVPEKAEEPAAEAAPAQAAGPQRVKRLAPRRRKRLQAAASGE